MRIVERLEDGSVFRRASNGLSQLAKILVGCFALTVGWCLAAHSEKPTLKVGAILHLTGDLAMSSAAFREGLEIGFEELRAEYPGVSLVLEDGHNSPSVSNRVGQKLLLVDKVRFVILESYLDVMSSGKLFERARVPSICLWDSSPAIEDAGDWIFAIGPWTPSAGTVASEFARSELGAKTAAIIWNADSWSEAVAKYFKDDFLARGGRVVFEETYSPTDVEFRSGLTRAIALRPDVFYTPLVFQLPAFYAQLKQLGYQGATLTSDIITDDHIKENPPHFEGIYQTGIAEPSGEEFAALRKKYLARFGKEMTQGWFVAVAYDSVRMLGEVLRRTGGSPTSEQMKDELYRIRNLKGASTTITINDKGASPQYETMYRIVAGELTPTNIVKATTGESRAVVAATHAPSNSK